MGFAFLLNSSWDCDLRLISWSLPFFYSKQDDKGYRSTWDRRASSPETSAVLADTNRTLGTGLKTPSLAQKDHSGSP